MTNSLLTPGKWVFGFRKREAGAGERAWGPRDGGYLDGVPGLVLQGPREDVVTQVEDEEADDEERAHAGPHGLPVPAQGAASHGLEVTFEPIWKRGRKSGLSTLLGEGAPGVTSLCLGRFCSEHHR